MSITTAKVSNVFFLVLVLSGCATPSVRPGGEADVPSSKPTASAVPAAPVAMPTIAYIVPTNAAYIAQSGVVKDLTFATFDTGPRVDHEMLSLSATGQRLSLNARGRIRATSVRQSFTGLAYRLKN